MAARKKVKASARKKPVTSNMPPEMRAAMQGAPSAPATQQSQQAANDWLADLTHIPATENKLMRKHFYIEIPQLDENGREMVEQVHETTIVDGKEQTTIKEVFVDPIIIDRMAYWKAETPRQRDGYVLDLGQQRISAACMKAVFLRLLDENGNRVFTNEQQFLALQQRGITEALETIGGHILGIAIDDSEQPQGQKETTVASEKEE